MLILLIMILKKKEPFECYFCWQTEVHEIIKASDYKNNV